MQVAQQEAFLAQINRDLKGGIIKEVHAFLEGDAGYFITEDVSDEKVLETVTNWIPWVTFELHKTVKFPLPAEIALKAARARAGMT